METGEVELYGVDFTPSVITINGYEELESTVQGYANKYRGLVFEEDGLKSAKAVRAEMNGVIKSLDNKRKEVKKAYNEPLNAFEKRINKLNNQIKEVINPIDAGIKDLEERQRNEKQTEVGKRVAEELENESNYVKENFEMDPKWCNQSVTMKKVAEEVAKAIEWLRREDEQIQKDILIISNYCKAVKVDSYAWLEMLKNEHSAPEVMKMIDNSLAEAKRREQVENERQERLERELKENEEFKAEQERIKQESYTELSVESLEDVYMEDDLDFLNIVEVEEHTVTLELTGTMDQLRALNDYINQLGLKVTAS